MGLIFIIPAHTLNVPSQFMNCEFELDVDLMLIFELCESVLDVLVGEYTYTDFRKGEKERKERGEVK